MIKLKSMLKKTHLLKEDNTPIGMWGLPESNKSINDEFRVNDWMLNEIKRIVEKANKKLKARALPQLEIEIVKEEVVSYRKDVEGGFGDEFKMPVYTIKVVGDIPPIKDYEFIAKIEHTEDGNIINMNPKSSVDKLPDEYKSFNQKCDICGTNRERLNTFIIKKVATDELIVAGSSCLKKFMPLDAVKAFVDYSIKLNDLRNVLADYENEFYGSDDFGYSGGGGRGKVYYGPEEIMKYVCIAYFSAGKVYVSKTKSEQIGKSSTLSIAQDIMHNLTSKFDSQREKAEYALSKYGTMGEDLSKQVLEWAEQQDYDKMAIENPKMDSYFHNLSVLIKRDFLEPKHLGYFASILGLYLREHEDKTDKQTFGVQYYGTVGEKIVDIPVQLVFTTSFETQYGQMFVYNMTDNKGHTFVYKGQPLRYTLNGTPVPLEKGDSILLSGTIKAHQEYKGTLQTLVQRPKIKIA